MTRVGHAVISGGSSGIGLALADRLARAGWDLTLLARDHHRLDAAEAALAAHGARVLTCSVDVADAGAVARALAAAIAANGPPTLVVACAGIVNTGLLAEQPLAAFERQIAVNYFGTLHLIHAALPVMRAAGCGRLVLVASAAALIGLYGYSSYAPSKFAVRGLAEALRSELAPHEIGVSVVYPPDTDTPGYREEVRHRSGLASQLAGSGGLMSADAVAAAILHGVARRRFVIAPGGRIAALAVLHSLIGPLLHRFWFDPLVARQHRPPTTVTAAKPERSGVAG